MFNNEGDGGRYETLRSLKEVKEREAGVKAGAFMTLQTGENESVVLPQGALHSPMWENRNEARIGIN